MIEKVIRKYIHLYNPSYPQKSLDEFIAAVKTELEVPQSPRKPLKEIHKEMQEINHRKPTEEELDELAGVLNVPEVGGMFGEGYQEYVFSNKEDRFSFNTEKEMLEFINLNKGFDFKVWDLVIDGKGEIGIIIDIFESIHNIYVVEVSFETSYYFTKKGIGQGREGAANYIIPWDSF